MRFYIGLIHYPVYNKNNEIIASAVTTFDLHDLSRLGKTYGAKGFYIVTPLRDQQDLAHRVMRHWQKGYGAAYNPDRKKALEIAMVSSSIEDSVRDIAQREGERPLLISTDAGRQEGKTISYGEVSKVLRSDRAVFLLFGTAWGLAKEFIEQSDYVLAPIEGVAGYNHLSVRTAAAVILDRLAGSYN